MNERDRLIEILSAPIFPRIGADPAEVVADYLLANGVIVPPCKVGQTVYELRKKSVSYRGRIHDYSISTMLSLRNAAVDEGAEIYIKEKPFAKSDNVRLGKTVFLTREEAEQALKERSEQP